VAGVYVEETADDAYDGQLRVYLGDINNVAGGLTEVITTGTGTAGSGGIGKLYAHSGNIV
jgi:hypothetical protein